jgi:methionine-rich copper-binding protein CopC
MRLPALLAAALALTAAPAFAHPLPKAASPAPNAVLAASPAEIRITFSEGLVLPFSGLEVADQAGHKADLGPPTLAPGDARQLVAPVRATLGPGVYLVTWHAVGDDTHHVSGHYSFEVKP